MTLQKYRHQLSLPQLTLLERIYLALFYKSSLSNLLEELLLKYRTTPKTKLAVDTYLCLFIITTYEPESFKQKILLKCIKNNLRNSKVLESIILESNILNRSKCEKPCRILFLSDLIAVANKHAY